MEIQQLINEKLSENLNKHGRLTVINKAGYKSTLYGYIRKLQANCIEFEDNETGERFKLPFPATFKPMRLKQTIL
jgi:hypothetical protein